MSTSVVTESHLRKIRVEIVSGVDLFRVDGTSGEAYFVVSVGKKKGKVKVNRKTTNLFLSPVTNMLMFTDIETDCKTIRIEFHDKERNKVVKKYYCEIAISQILPFDTQHTFTNSLELLDNEGIKQGDYYLTPKITVSMYLFQTKDKIYEREVLSKPNPLIEAVKKTDLCLVLYCLEHFKQIINQPDGSTGNTALHYSTFEYHNEHIILTLLKNSHVDIHAENADKNNPFHFFCSNFRNPNCADVFELFLRRGICINAVNKQNECPLHRAIGNNSIRMLLVELLLKNGADVNAKTDKGQTALHYAVFMRRVDLLSTLLVYGADLNIANKVGDTPLSWCEKKLQNTNFLTTFRHILELMEYLNSINAEQKSIRILVKNKLFIWKLKSLTPRALAGLGILENVEQMKLVKNFKTLTVTDQSSHGDSARASNASASLTASTGDDSEHILTWVHKKEKCEYTSEICKTTKCSVFTLLLEGDENTYAAKAFDNATLPTAVFNSNSKIFQHLKHDNLVSVIGVVEEENALLLEYSSLGNLAGILDSQQLRWTDVFFICTSTHFWTQIFTYCWCVT
ncbi:Serine/threonine protein kinase TNNI3K [Entamoeba marina]